MRLKTLALTAALVSLTCAGCKTLYPELYYEDWVLRRGDPRNQSCNALQRDANALRGIIDSLTAKPLGGVTKDRALSFIDYRTWPALPFVPPWIIGYEVTRSDRLMQSNQRLKEIEKALHDSGCPAEPASAVSASDADPTASVLVAATASLPGGTASASAPTVLFDGPALWHPDWRAGALGRPAPPQGVAGRLVVFADGGVSFFERTGSAGVEAPYVMAREAIARVECTLPSFAMMRADGTAERFAALSAANGATDDAVTERVCRLVRDSLQQGPR